MQQKEQVTPPKDTEPPTPRVTHTVDAVSTRQQTNMAEHQLSVALTWTRRGIPVIPCSRTDKGPMVKGFARDAAPEDLAPFSDPEQVRAWWTGRFKRAHVGILTGRGTDGRGLVVVDLDMPKDGSAPLAGRWADCSGGTDVLELLMREAGAQWPDTYTVLTPSGGMHLYFQQPTEGSLIGCATGDGPGAPHLGPLVDVRGVGGLVIAAGSHSAAQGKPYTRVSPADVLPQPLPVWLLKLLRRPDAPRQKAQRPGRVHQLPSGSRAERYAAAALSGEADKVESAPDGKGNDTLFAAARRLGELSATAPAVLDETTVTDDLLAAARAAGHPERAALRTIRSGWERGIRDGHGAGAA